MLQIIIRTSYAPERLNRHVKSVCLLNVVINQEILINTYKTK